MSYQPQRARKVQQARGKCRIGSEGRKRDERSYRRKKRAPKKTIADTDAMLAIVRAASIRLKPERVLMRATSRGQRELEKNPDQSEPAPARSRQRAEGGDSGRLEKAKQRVEEHQKAHGPFTSGMKTSSTARRERQRGG